MTPHLEAPNATSVIGIALVAGLALSQAGMLPETITTHVNDGKSAVEQAANDTGDTLANATTRDELNQTKIETLVHQKINDRRQNHDLNRLEHDSELASIARYHSQDMVARDYYAHDGPDGETISDRYDNHGYNCRVPVSDNRYATGAENINIVTAYINVKRPHDGEIVSYDTNEEIATGLVNQWMHSTGHRKNILKPHWQNEGIGVNITTNDEGETVVYATQNFC